MMKPNLSKDPEFAVKYEFNRWADYIELNCLLNPDGELSMSDVVRFFSERDDDGDMSLMRGTSEYCDNLDNLHGRIKIYFQYIRSRSRYLQDYYPFSIDEDMISIKQIDEKKRIYIFLLFSSNLSFFSKQEMHSLTKTFEIICKHSLSLMYPNFQTELFGTANSPGDTFYGGNVIDKLEILSNYLRTGLSQKCKNNPKYKQPAGDAGLDLVSFIMLDTDDSSTSRIPVCFGQCACSPSRWREKQSEILFGRWHERFTTLPAYHELIFVPFSLRSISGQWDSEYDDQIYTIAVDRFRIIHILQMYGGNDTSFFSQLSIYNDLCNSIAQLYA